MTRNDLFYTVKPFIPRALQLALRRGAVTRKRSHSMELWPIDYHAGGIPAGWNGWPNRKKFALVLTHDIDTLRGQMKAPSLIRLEQELGFKSAFYVVPERYRVFPETLRLMAGSGFEIGVHGLKHDGKLFRSRLQFDADAVRINRYLREWNAEGFRAPSMIRNLDWIGELNIRYDASTFDTDPFEPQSEGVGTIFPFWIPRKNSPGGFVELPYTLAQDFTLFILMKERSTELWKRKLEWIVEKNGMALINTHPDYINFSGHRLGPEEYPISRYRDFLEYIKHRYAGQYWSALPRDIAAFWRHTIILRQTEPFAGEPFMHLHAAPRMQLERAP
jgi:peptidoglycan/xylan/chitin deacetylase (PgdA/CDA1 family)